MSNDQRYIEFFLNASGALYEIDCLELSHPQFAVPFRYTMANPLGLDVQHEDGSPRRYNYQLMGITAQTVRNDLDQKLDATIVDYDDTLIEAVEEIESGAVQVALRKYRSDDLTSPVHTIKTLEARKISKDSDGKVTFAAEAASLNSVGTGELYTLSRFPLLRGTL